MDEERLCGTALTRGYLRDLLLSPSSCFYNQWRKTNDPPPRTVRLEAKQIAEGSGFTSTVLRVFLQWEWGCEGEEANEQQQQQSLPPSSCIVKVIGSTRIQDNMPTASEQVTNSLNDMLERAHEVECRIYDLEGLNATVPMPKCYVKCHRAGPEKPRIMILEDLTDQMQPVSFISLGLHMPEAKLEQLLQVLSDLHAWSVNEQQWTSKIPTMRDSGVTAPMAEVIMSMYPACKEAFPAEFAKLDQDRMDKYFSMEKFNEVFGSDPKTRYNLPTVLVHGDIHQTNVLFEKKQIMLALIDWQLSHQGCAMEDLNKVFIWCVPFENEEGRDRILARYITMYNEKVEKPENCVTFEDSKKALDIMYAFSCVMWSFTLAMADNMAKGMFKGTQQKEQDEFKARMLEMNFKRLKEAMEAYGW